MSKGELEFDDLGDFFERSYEVSSKSDTSWVFTSTSERFDGYTVEFIGTGLASGDTFPSGGTIEHVIITGPGGVTDDVDGLSLSASELASEFDFGDHDDEESGDDGDDSLHGDGGDDDLLGDGGDDDLMGKGGDDFLSGDDGDDYLKGQGGDDEIHGGDGRDKIIGGGGKDMLSGDAGDDRLKGQGGKDILDGGDDDDYLDGGGGKDIFVFTTGFGNDEIKRFQHDKDKIDLTAFGITTFDSQVSIEKTGGDTVITVRDGTGTVVEGTITIDKVSGGKSVDAGDFLI
mgnify:CR=1 FL=1